MDLLLCPVVIAYGDEYLAIYTQFLNSKPFTHMGEN